MVVQISTPVLNEVDVENLVGRVFLKSIDLLGGITKLAEYRTLTWLPSLARAAYVIVLKEEYLRTEEEIAGQVGLTRNTVRSIVRSDPQLALYKIEHIDELTAEAKRELHVHVAGGIAKLAYKLVKEGEESQLLMELARSAGMEAVKVCDAPWAYIVLKRSKGIRYPLRSADLLLPALEGVKIKGYEASEVLSQLQYPIKTPAQLLHEIKEFLDMHAAS